MIEIIEQYEMSVGLVLLIRSEGFLMIGDVIQNQGKRYRIEGFLHPSGYYGDNKVAVIVKPV